MAWAAHAFGCNAVIYLPRGSEPERLSAIARYGAQVECLDATYDGAVAHAAAMAQSQGWWLIQDTAWEGYTAIPELIQQGYFSLLNETASQLGEALAPTHLFIQAGVGSLPAALVAQVASANPFSSRPLSIVVEPTAAPCVFRSMLENDGNSVSVEGDLNTIMAGLACGTPSTIALEVLRTSADAFVRCDDAFAVRGMRILGNPLAGDPAITSGESGAVSVGIIEQLMINPHFAQARDDLQLNESSRILVLSTEGDTAPDAYRRLVWGTPDGSS